MNVNNTISIVVPLKIRSWCDVPSPIACPIHYHWRRHRSRSGPEAICLPLLTFSSVWLGYKVVPSWRWPGGWLSNAGMGRILKPRKMASFGSNHLLLNTPACAPLTRTHPLTRYLIKWYKWTTAGRGIAWYCWYLNVDDLLFAYNKRLHQYTRSDHFPECIGPVLCNAGLRMDVKCCRNP